jgi:hypothetical protein
MAEVFQVMFLMSGAYGTHESAGKCIQLLNLTLWLYSASELYLPPLVGKVSTYFCG